MLEIWGPKGVIFTIPRGQKKREKLPFRAGYLQHGVEFQNSPRWRQLYPHKLSTATPHAHIPCVVVAVGGGAIDFTPSAPYITISFVLCLD